MVQSPPPLPGSHDTRCHANHNLARLAEQGDASTTGGPCLIANLVYKPEVYIYNVVYIYIQYNIYIYNIIYSKYTYIITYVIIYIYIYS